MMAITKGARKGHKGQDIRDKRAKTRQEVQRDFAN